MHPQPSMQNFQPNDSSSEVMHSQSSVQKFQSNVSTSEVSDCACDKAPSTNDLRPIDFPSDLPISSVVCGAGHSVATADFANFANVVGNPDVWNHMNDPLDLCHQPTGCNAPDWSLTVIIPCYRRISRFEDMTSVVAASSARIDRIIFAFNGAPVETVFRTKIDAFKTNADVLAKKIRVDIISSTLEVGFYIRFQVAQWLDTVAIVSTDSTQTSLTIYTQKATVAWLAVA
jgi:hypothetical protein